MAKIHTLEISNFRGIKNFKQVFERINFVCLIGRGDSGKTTILDAISYVLSPSWSVSFYDTDFYEANIAEPIIIEASLYDVPFDLLKESKYGLYTRGLNKTTNIIYDEIEDDHELVLTIRLIVEQDLEPRWFVISNRQDPIEIRAVDREAFNVYLVSDYLDRHFSWNKGNPLYTLLRQDELERERKHIFIDAFREAKAKIDASDFKHLEGVVTRIKKSAQRLGINIDNATTTLDLKDIMIKDGRVCLHEDKIPFRLKGKGSKRLISIAIQMELANNGGILLIDEIEQGLEPDRAQHLANYLKQNNTGQIFLTTHSTSVLVELQAVDLFKMVRGDKALFNLSNDLQGLVRKNPEAFFAEKIMVCEGATEKGICRALNNLRMVAGKTNAAFKGIRIADGSGSNLVEYVFGLVRAGYPVGLFCDSDVKKVNDQKAAMKTLGVQIFDTEDKLFIEEQLFKDLPWVGIKELITYHLQGKDENAVLESIAAKLGKSLPADWTDKDSAEIRAALAKTACVDGKEWFKRMDHGQFIGEVCYKYLPKITDCGLKTLLTGLEDWFEND